MKMTFDPTQLQYQHVLEMGPVSEPIPPQHVPDTTNTSLVSKYGSAVLHSCSGASRESDITSFSNSIPLKM